MECLKALLSSPTITVNTHIQIHVYMSKIYRIIKEIKLLKIQWNQLNPWESTLGDCQILTGWWKCNFVDFMQLYMHIITVSFFIGHASSWERGMFKT